MPEKKKRRAVLKAKMVELSALASEIFEILDDEPALEQAQDKIKLSLVTAGEDEDDLSDDA